MMNRENSNMVVMTDSAQAYLAQLLAKQDVTGIAVRMFVTQPGTSQAETCLAYCRPEEVNEKDYSEQLDHFRLYLDTPSLPYLEEATVDFAEDKMGGQLTIKAPNAKMPKVNKDSPIEEQINYLLFTEVNPSLASHGGDVSLVEVTSEGVAILKFGGGCQGCSAVNTTLKEGVEATLLEKIEGLTGVKDETDHTVTDNAYFK